MLFHLKRPFHAYRERAEYSLSSLLYCLTSILMKPFCLRKWIENGRTKDGFFPLLLDYLSKERKWEIMDRLSLIRADRPYGLRKKDSSHFLYISLRSAVFSQMPRCLDWLMKTSFHCSVPLDWLSFRNPLWPSFVACGLWLLLVS